MGLPAVAHAAARIAGVVAMAAAVGGLCLCRYVHGHEGFMAASYAL